MGWAALMLWLATVFNWFHVYEHRKRRYPVNPFSTLIFTVAAVIVTVIWITRKFTHAY
jgi:O-antigen/teichoic acid export membrane protein